MQIITSKLNLKIVYGLSDNQNNNQVLRSLSAALYFNVILTKLTFLVFLLPPDAGSVWFCIPNQHKYSCAVCECYLFVKRSRRHQEHVKFVDLQTVYLFARNEI